MKRQLLSSSQCAYIARVLFESSVRKGVAFPSKIDISFYNRPGWSSGSTNIDNPAIPPDSAFSLCYWTFYQTRYDNAFANEGITHQELLTVADFGRRSLLDLFLRIA